MSESLSRRDLYNMLRDSIAGDGSVESMTSQPYRVFLSNINVKFDIYLWNVIFTCDISNKRPRDEYRMNFNIHPRHVDWSSGGLPTYCGYCADYQVFVLWDSKRHDPQITRGNLQVKVSALIEGFSKDIAFHDRFVNRGIETIIVCTPEYLSKALEYRYNQYLDDLCNDRPDILLESHSNHNGYGSVYRYCINHPDETIFELSYHLSIPVKELTKILSVLYSTHDFSRDPVRDEKSFIDNKISELRQNEPSLSLSDIIFRLHIPLDYAKENGYVSEPMLEEFYEDNHVS